MFSGYIFIMCLIGITVTNIVRKIIKQYYTPIHMVLTVLISMSENKYELFQKTFLTPEKPTTSPLEK